MKRIIEEVLQAEERLSDIIKKAREKAAEIKLSAEKENTEKLNDAKQQALAIVQTKVENAKKQAERISEEKLKKARGQKDILLNEKSAEIDTLVDNICEIILTTGNKRDSK
jgi:vacuolar-type H+-ATPase subunit H